MKLWQRFPVPFLNADGTTGAGGSAGADPVAAAAAGTDPNGGGQQPEKKPAIVFETPEAFAARMDREANSRLKKLAESLGFSSVEEMQEAARAARQAQEANKSELEKAQERIKALETEKAQALAQAEQMLIAAEVKALSVKLGIVDPDAALALMDREGVKVKEGRVEGVEEALKSLLKAKPYLKAQQAPSSGGGDFSGAGVEPKSLEQQIAEAEAKGDWDTAMRLKNELFKKKFRGG